VPCSIRKRHEIRKPADPHSPKKNFPPPDGPAASAFRQEKRKKRPGLHLRPERGKKTSVNGRKPVSHSSFQAFDKKQTNLLTL